MELYEAYTGCVSTASTLICGHTSAVKRIAVHSQKFFGKFQKGDERVHRVRRSLGRPWRGVDRRVNVLVIADVSRLPAVI